MTASPVITLLLERIRSKHAHVGVIGLGYVGLPLAVELAHAGFDVTGFDVDASKTSQINAGKSYIPDVPEADLAACVRAGTLKATTDMRAARWDGRDRHLRADAAAKDEGPRSLLRRAGGRGRGCDAQARVSWSSSNRRPIRARPTKSCSRCSRKVASKADRTSSWRFRPSGSIPAISSSTRRTFRRSSAASDPRARRRRPRSTARPSQTVVPVSSTRVAEMVKLLENTFRAVNIGLVNEIALMCHKMDIDVWEVIDAAKTKPFGFMPFYPGPGLGGHCIPIDPFYLSWKARQIRLRVPLHRACRPDQLLDAAVRRRTGRRSA